MIRYCPKCWAQNPYEATVCANCSASLEEHDKDYVTRLIEAVEHPEPTSAAFVIELLGRQMREQRAVNAIMTRMERNPDSMDVTAAAAEALGYIGNPRAIPALSAVLLDTERPLPARLAAAEALAKFDEDAAAQALASALTSVRLPSILRRSIDALIVQENQR